MNAINTSYKNAIDITGLSKEYGSYSIKNLNLKVEKGTVMGLIGQNGAGKTTLIKSILNLIKTDGGDIKVFGLNNITNEKDIKNDIGVVFDELGIPDTLNCKMINSIMKNIYSNWNSDIFTNYTAMFKLPDDKSFKNFSRGMRMKLQVAIALSHDAKLLILDEATSGLDPISRNELLDILLEYMEDENHSILVSSHITSDLERIADYITFIDDGKILLTGEKYEISESHFIAKGNTEVINSIPSQYVISTRKSSYGCEALVKNPELIRTNYPDLVIDKASFDDILYFYVKQPTSSDKIN